jgi:hypothetical protein
VPFVSGSLSALLSSSFISGSILSEKKFKLFKVQFQVSFKPVWRSPSRIIFSCWSLSRIKNVFKFGTIKATRCRKRNRSILKSYCRNRNKMMRLHTITVSNLRQQPPEVIAWCRY